MVRHCAVSSFHADDRNLAVYSSRVPPAVSGTVQVRFWGRSTTSFFSLKFFHPKIQHLKKKFFHFLTSISNKQISSFRPHFSEAKRIVLSYSVCVTLMLGSMVQVAQALIVNNILIFSLTTQPSTSLHRSGQSSKTSLGVYTSWTMVMSSSLMVPRCSRRGNT